MVCHTGFGVVAEHLLRYLHNSGGYEVRAVAINYHGDRYHETPFFVYPTSPGDMFGFNHIWQALNDWGAANIDAVLMLQDPWNIKRVINRIDPGDKGAIVDQAKKINPNLKFISYFPVDGEPFSDEWIKTVEKADLNITYTEWGREAVRKALRQFGMESVHRVELLPHALGGEEFFLLPPDKRHFYRRKRGWSDKFVVFTVNRFQPRKNFFSTLLAMNLFVGGYKKCACGHYYPAAQEFCDLNGCPGGDAKDTVEGKPEVRFYIHADQRNYAMGGYSDAENNLLPLLRSAGFSYEQVNRHVELLPNGYYESGRIGVRELNQIYNAGDMFITSTLGEGWGLTVHEALATGTPVICPYNSSLPEVTGGHATLVRNCGYANLPFDMGRRRPLADVAALVNALEEHYAAWVANGKQKVLNEAGAEYARRYSWEQAGARLDELIRDCVSGGARIED